jgi:hypothetical protein
MTAKLIILAASAVIGASAVGCATSESYDSYSESGYAYYDDGSPYAAPPPYVSSQGYPYYDYGYWNYRGYGYTGIGSRHEYDRVRYGDRHDYRGRDDDRRRDDDRSRGQPQPPSLRDQVALERGDDRRPSSPPAPRRDDDRPRGDDRPRADPPRQNGHGPVTNPPSPPRNSNDRPSNPRGGR